MKKWIVVFGLLGIIVFVGLKYSKQIVFNSGLKVGQKTDSINGVYVYFNGKVSNVEGRNTKEGYNLGLKYQCVEFVKRYYYESLNHKMPDASGHAKSFFNKKLKDGAYNEQRNLVQYSNPSTKSPKVGDLIIFDGTFTNKYGHVAITSKVMCNSIEIIQQNSGTYGKSRVTYQLENKNEKFLVKHDRILGWLRKE